MGRGADTVWMTDTVVVDSFVTEAEERCRHHLDEAIKRDGDNPEAHHLLASFFLSKDEPEVSVMSPLMVSSYSSHYLYNWSRCITYKPYKAAGGWEDLPRKSLMHLICAQSVFVCICHAMEGLIWKYVFVCLFYGITLF